MKTSTLRKIIREEISKLLTERKYYYFINSDERGNFYADVRTGLGGRAKTVFEIKGDDIFRDGWMKNKYDLDGLTEYLIYLGIIRSNDEVRKGQF